MNDKTKKIRCDKKPQYNKNKLVLLATTLVAIASLVTIATVPTTAYAQEDIEPGGEGLTVTATCEEQVDPTNNIHFNFLEIDVEGEQVEEKSSFLYLIEVVTPEGQTLQSFHRGGPPVGPGDEGARQGYAFLEGGQTYSIAVYEEETDDFNADFGEPFFTTEVTCPELEEPEPVPLTERFPNQGSCISEANNNPNAGFTKDDCKAAFKNKSKST